MSIIVVALLVVTAVSLGLAGLGERSARREQHRLRQLVLRDRLTGLPNRAALDAALADLVTAKRDAGRAAVILVELDHFDHVNETSGHEIGDLLLIAASDRLRDTMAPGESLYRLSGPQFVVLAPHTLTREVAEARALDLQTAVRVQYRVDHDHLKISASAAVLMLDQRHVDPAIVIEDAIAAIRHATSIGPGSLVVFELSMRGAPGGDMVEQRVRDAFDNREFLLMYLPVVDLKDSTIVGVEALLRWADPQRGVMPAGDFLGLLIKAGILGPVSEWVIAQACRDNFGWQQRFPKTDIVSTVNVAPTQVADLDFPDQLQRIVKETGADPARLCIELTGAPHPDELDLIWRNLRLVKEQGWQVALDDFGVGFATLDFVRRFSLDIIKIDRSLVQTVSDSEADTAIIRQLVLMAHQLGLLTIAEGVDSAEHAALLAELGCELAQGHYWSQAVSLESVDKLIARRTIRPIANRAKRIDWKAPSSTARGA